MIVYKKGMNIILFFDILFSLLLIFMLSLSYFLGFNINVQSLGIYFICFLGILLLGVIVYVIIYICNKNYIVIEKDGIYEYQKDNIILISKFIDIKHITYYSIFDIFIYSDGGSIRIEKIDGTVYIPIPKKKKELLEQYVTIWNN